MIDSLPPPPGVLEAIVQPIADTVGLKTLPLHAHEILLALCLYHVLNIYLSPAFSRRFFPATYPNLSPKTKVNWDVHVTSMVQAVFICSVALWVVLKDEERKHMNARERIWGYTGAMGMIQAFAAGYFAWDIMVSSMHLDVLGPGSLAHAISALIVTCLGFVSLVFVLRANMRLIAILASICELLRHSVCSLRTVYSISQLPLVPRQMQHDWLSHPAIQRYTAPHCLLWVSAGVGDLSNRAYIPRHLVCPTYAWRH